MDQRILFLTNGAETTDIKNNKVVNPYLTVYTKTNSKSIVE